MPTRTKDGAEEWAVRLIKNKATNAIVSPVRIEVLAGVRDTFDREITEAFLAKFALIDERKIPVADWLEAERIAKRVVTSDREVPRRQRRREPQSRPQTESRQLGYCLILAIANRLNYEVVSNDKGLRRQQGRTN